MKEYKATEKFTFGNVLMELEISNCDEAKAHVVDFFIWIERQGLRFNYDISPEDFEWIISSLKRRAWLLKRGYIEEVVTLPACPFCGNSDSVEVDTKRDQHRVVCSYLKEGCGAASGWRDTIKEAQAAWVKREGKQ
jgi:hypothetical protein